MCQMSYTFNQTKRPLIFSFALLLSLLFSFAPAATAQTAAPVQTPSAPPETDATPKRREREGRRGHLLSRLSLTPEQREQIRQIRQQTETEGRQLLRRIREARRALDLAIYFEDADETVIEQRTRELSAAQAEATRLRALTELRIRRVLTAEQLEVLREIRRQAAGRAARRPEGDETFGENSFGARRRHHRHRPPADADAQTNADETRPAPDFAPRTRRNTHQQRAPRPESFSRTNSGANFTGGR